MTSDGSKAAAVLYREHKRSLRRYVLRLVPHSNPAHADDMVQETFTRVVAHLKSGKKLESPKRFLFATARNLITSTFYRSRQHRETDCSPHVEGQAGDTDICSAEARAIIQQQMDVLTRGIADLPERYQEAFVRRRIWGESCSEIAAKMGLSERAVTNYAVIGWKLLKEHCERHGIPLGGLTDDHRA